MTIKWTEEQEAEIKKQAVTGGSGQDLAHQFGYAPHTVYSKARKLGTPFPRATGKKATNYRHAGKRIVIDKRERRPLRENIPDAKFDFSTRQVFKYLRSKGEVVFGVKGDKNKKAFLYNGYIVPKNELIRLYEAHKNGTSRRVMVVTA